MNMIGNDRKDISQKEDQDFEQQKILKRDREMRTEQKMGI